MTPIFRPVELSVRGIRTVIIDPHNEILPFWFREALNRRCRLIAVRIDAHHDMFQCCPALPSREGWGRFEFMERLLPALQEYSRHSLNEGNFTCPAFHYDVLGALYHFHPGKNRIDAYGTVSGSETLDAPRTAVVRDSQNSGRLCRGGGCGSRAKWIVWEKVAAGPPQVWGGSNECNGFKGPDGCNAKTAPQPRRIMQSDFKREMEDCELPVAIGFDLDGLYGNEDRRPPDEIIRKRREGIVQVLRSVSRPAFICIARSQNPRSYVPADMVDRVQQSALGIIKEAYG